MVSKVAIILVSYITNIISHIINYYYTNIIHFEETEYDLIIHMIDLNSPGFDFFTQIFIVERIKLLLKLRLYWMKLK